MAGTASENSVDWQKLQVEAEKLISQFHNLADTLAFYHPPEDARLKAGQLQEISKTITVFETRKFPVPPELRQLKSSLLSQTHEFAAAGNLFAMLEQELTDILGKLQMKNGPRLSIGDRRPPRLGDCTPGRVLRECIIKSLKAHSGRAKTSTVLNEVGEMLKDKLTAADLDLDYYNNNPIWRRNASLQRRKMVLEGIVNNETEGGYWELTPQFATSSNK